MEENDKVYQELINIIKLFNNRPYHLAKYLIDNNALSESFIRKVTNSNIIINQINFKDITQMNDYYNSLLDKNIKEKTKENLSIEMSKKLDTLLKEEKYEEAIYIRDYMIKNNIPRIL